MEGTCNECVFPLNKDASEDICSTDTSLIYAAETGKLSCVKELIASGADVNAVNYYTYTALMSAACNGHVDCVKELVKAGSDVNATDGVNTALSVACEKDNKVIARNHVDCLKELIAAGADVNATNSYGRTALMRAASNGHVDCVKELVKAGAELNAADSSGSTALTGVAYFGPVDCLKELVKAGAELNATDSQGDTALVCAVYSGSVDCAEELVKAGADVNVFGKILALVDACEKDNEAIVKLLLKGGADVNCETFNGRTALYVAVTCGHAAYKREKSKKKLNDSPDIVDFQLSVHTNMVFLLLTAGAHLNKTSSGLKPCTVHLQPPYSDTPNVHILKMLSIAGADVGYREMKAEEIKLKSLTRFCVRRYLQQSHQESNLYHSVPKLGLPFTLQSYLLFDTLPKYYQDLDNDEREFLLKVSEGDIENASELVKRGVDVNVQNENDMTALMIASETGHVEFLEELLRAGADVNIQNSVGDTALILATMKGQHKDVKELLKFGADCNIQGKMDLQL